MKILNSNQHPLEVSTKKAIEKQVESIEYLGDVVIGIANDNTDEAPIYNVCDLESNYLFSIDTDGDVIFER